MKKNYLLIFQLMIGIIFSFILPAISNANNNSLTNIEYSTLNSKNLITSHPDFIENYSDAAQSLLELTDAVRMRSFKNSKKIISYQNFKKIKLAFSFDGLKNFKNENIIGYSTAGDLTKKGWTGIKIYFIDPSLGVCSYSLDLVQSLNLNPDNKNSSTFIEGSSRTGYLYSLRWIDNKHNKILQCADKHLEKEKMSKLLLLATKINKN